MTAVEPSGVCASFLAEVDKSAQESISRMRAGVVRSKRVHNADLNLINVSHGKSPLAARDI